MVQRDALERGMAALEAGTRIAVTRKRARPSVAANASDELRAEAEKDAEAWNLLRHLSTII